MGMLKQLFWGTSVGFALIYFTPEEHYRIMKRNLYKPISKEINKDIVDLVQLTRLAIEGVENTITDFARKSS